MSNMITVRLKPGKETSLKNKHRWVFSGAISSTGGAQDGDEVRVCDEKGAFLAR